MTPLCHIAESGLSFTESKAVGDNDKSTELVCTAAIILCSQAQNVSQGAPTHPLPTVVHQHNQLSKTFSIVNAQTTFLLPSWTCKVQASFCFTRRLPVKLVPCTPCGVYIPDLEQHSLLSSAAHIGKQLTCSLCFAASPVHQVHAENV